MVDQQRLILFPGMGADERLFDAQRQAGLQFEVPEFPSPEGCRTLPEYARKVGEQLGIDDDCVLGGVSFGGMLACQIASECGARAVILVSSCRNRSAIPKHYWAAERVARWLPDRFIQKRCALGCRWIAKLESLGPEQASLVHDMAREVPVAFLRKVGRMVLKWEASDELPCPVFAMHGTADRVIPIHKIQPDEVIEGGGHLISLSHADQVTTFIEDTLQKLAEDASVSVIPGVAQTVNG